MFTKLNANILSALPMFIAVNIAGVIIWLLNITEQSMALILGIIGAGLVDLDNRLSGRLKNIFYTLIAFSISSLTTQYFLNQGLWFILVMTAMTFLFTMVGALGQRYSTIAFGTLVISLYTSLTYHPDINWYLNPLLILSGTLLYSLISVLVYLCFPNRPLQESISRTFLALADYLDAKATFFDPDDIEDLSQKQINLAMANTKLTNAFSDAQTALFYRLRGNLRQAYTSQMSRYLFSAQDIYEGANSSFVDYKLLAKHLKNTDLIFRILRLLELEAQACRNIAYCLQQNQNFHTSPHLERAILGISQSLELFAENLKQKEQSNNVLTSLKSVVTNLKTIHLQLQSLSNQETPKALQDHRLINQDKKTNLGKIWETLHSHFTFQSPLFRHAVRLSIVVFACCMIVEIFALQSERGYWILLTAIFVCQPNYSATKLRLKQRIIGTILGVIVASGLPYLASSLEGKLAVVVITSTLFQFFRTNNYSFSTFFITIQVLASFDIMGMDIYQATLPRLADTLIGAGIAWLAVSYLWSDWKYLQFDRLSQQAIQHNANYLLHIVSLLEFGYLKSKQKGNLKYRLARNSAHDSANALNTLIATMNKEPKKYANYLQQGFELLKLNTALLGYISALGRYHHKMKNADQNLALSPEFYPISKKIIGLLNHINSPDTQETKNQLSAVQFEQVLQEIKQAFNAYNTYSTYSTYSEQTDSNTVQTLNIPMQQLQLISQLLPSLYQVMSHNKSH